MKSGPEVNDDAKEKETELRSGTSRTVASTVAKRLVRTVRFEDQPTVSGIDEALRHMTTDTAERDDRRALIYVDTVRPALAAMKYASEKREAGLRERIGKGVRERQVGEAAAVGRAGDGAMARRRRWGKQIYDNEPHGRRRAANDNADSRDGWTWV